MQARELDRRDSGKLQIDLCFTCTGIWFDHLESSMLAPAAVVGLFRDIQTHAPAHQPVASRMDCPRCAAALVPTQDLSKGGRFSYFRCPTGDGRYTPFFQFLREKQFVRTLTPQELQQVRAQVREVRCSECGAPIDLEHDVQCKYCRTPVSVLDADAVTKAMAIWTQAEQRRQPVPAADRIADALLKPSRPAAASPSVQDSVESATAAVDSIRHLMLDSVSPRGAGDLLPDLVALGVSAVAGLFASRE